MPTFHVEVEGAHELIEGALSQVTVNGPENHCLIQFQINHNFSVFHVHAHPFAQVQFLLHPFASFRTSSILIVPIHILVSICALSCSACLQFGAVTCVSHVLQCACAHTVPFA